MDGQHQDTQDLKAHITVQLEEMFASEELLLMLITKPVYSLVSLSQELTLRSCQDNGSSRLVLVLELIWEITSMLPDIFS